MINDAERLKLLAQSEHGRTLMAFLEDQIGQMSDIVKIKTYEELVGKQEATKILKELFSFLERACEKEPNLKKTDYS
jgi:hypothetical protein